MAQPQAYNREVDFTERDGDDTNHAGINAELDAAALSINQIRDNLELIQKDDGSLQNGIVGAEQLAPTAFDAIKTDLNEAVTDAQTAAASSTLAANTSIAARDAALAAQAAAETANTSSALNATTASTKAAEANASAAAAATSATASSNSATASQTSRLASEAARDVALSAQAAAAASQAAAAASQTAAAFSETNAATSAATATTQAGIATTQAASASASATAAAASLDSFDDRYLGSKTTDPTTDNDGNALVTGALYFNSAAGEMRVWAGTFWKATGSSVGGTINTAKYTATAGQTTFAIVYDVGFIHVYLNGVKLESGVEFTANNGTSVVLATGATAGDVVDMIAFGIFSVANTYTKAEADALLGAKAPQSTTYTKTEVDTALSGKQALLGYTPLNSANPSYTGALTGGTGEVDIGSGQIQKSANGRMEIQATYAASTIEEILRLSRVGGSPSGGARSAALTFFDALNGTLTAAVAGRRNNPGNDFNGDLSFYVSNTGGGNATAVSQLTERYRIGFDGSQASTIPGGSTLYPEFKCRAWVNFNGTGTVAIRASGNVSSITDNGVGDYTVNFTTAMPDANYGVSTAGPNGSNGANITALNLSSTATGSCRVVQSATGPGGGGQTDSTLVCVSIFR